MFDWLVSLKDKIFARRTTVLIALFVLFSSILIIRLFVLQIIMGSSYQDNYNLKVEKTQSIEATRGNIYDRNGELLAYNELTYAVTIEDVGEYETTSEKNEKLNNILYNLIVNIEKNGDSIVNDFGIALDGNGNYQFVNPEGTKLQRFRADVFGYADPNDLTYNKKMNFDESTASADQVMEYLCSKYRYDISAFYPKEFQYKICILRYGMGLNAYQKYISTVIANDVNPMTVAYVEENKNELTGVAIEEKSVRKYDEAPALSSIVGYVGKISPEEYKELSDKSDDYSLTDTIGKVGIEKIMDEQLTGKKGSETIYVDSLGNPISTANKVEAVPGNDVYLSIDKNLQVSAYKLLEQQIAGILSSKIANIKEFNVGENTDEKQILLPVYDVYYAFIKNNLIDRSELNAGNATECEKAVYDAYKAKEEEVHNGLKAQLLDNNYTPYNALPKEYQAYNTYFVQMLKDEKILDADEIDKKDDVYKAWAAETISTNEYLKYAIEENWIDISKLPSTSKYMDTDELYEVLVNYGLEKLYDDNDFVDVIYKYAIQDNSINPNYLCAILYDQEVLPYDAGTRNALARGSLSAYGFVISKIRSLELTPGMIGLDLCSGSCVVLDSTSGEVLACVSYPGYDSNQLANPKDTKYYSFISLNNSRPLYNYATQQKTAPGSTFKPCSATAGLTEGVISPGETIVDKGIFEKVSNQPKCWAYPSNHGAINVAQALRDSCNYFFYEVGYRLAGGDSYNDSKGIKKIQKYASMFGLDEKTGLEIEESQSTLADEFPVMAAIGQSNHNITTVALARYATAIASRGNVYDLTLLNKVTDSEGNVIETYSPSVKRHIEVVDSSTWNAVQSGMRMMIEDYNNGSFNALPVAVAGKTGTAQQSNDKPNHALFIGFAPYESPQIAFATRIAFGYTSHNAADVTRNILGCYYNLPEFTGLVNGQATEVTSSSAVTD